MNPHPVIYMLGLPMVIYDLCCSDGHRFEGWFKDLAAYEEQHLAAQLCCPTCGTADVTRQLTGSAIRRSAEDRMGTTLPSAPAAVPAPTAAPTAAPAAVPAVPEGPVTPPSPAQVREFLGVLGAVLRASSEDVGPRFADEARKIHQGQAPERMIRGTSTPEEEEALAEDGVPFLKVPVLETDD